MNRSRRELLVHVMAALAASASELPRAAPAQNGRKLARPSADPWRLPRKQAVSQVENLWIPLTTDMRLAARLWLPEQSHPRAVPVVLEYNPYRKRDTTREMDDVTGQYLGERGIGFARVDVPGSGDSDGTLADEYLSVQQLASVEAIAWLARQPWCNGSVGMRGYSWGAQACLQAAMQRPPALKAIMPFCASDHRFEDDAHWIGGALGWSNFQWAAFFKGVQASPPDPAIVGERWRDMWRARLAAAGNIAATWVSHQRDDDYWRNGDVSSDYGGIVCPVYLVGGLLDSYTNSIPRLLERLTAHRQALIGPWAHSYPELGSPGPTLDWGHEEVRWWYQWLYGQETGITREPTLRVYVPEKTASEVYPASLPGRWIATDHWPPTFGQGHTFWLAPGTLQPTPSAAARLTVHSEVVVGLGHPEWLPFYQDVDLPTEQSADDAGSSTFDSDALAFDLDILGRPSVKLSLTSDRPVAYVAVRLNTVLPDGRSWNLSYGIVNISRLLAASPSNAPVELEVPLNFCVHHVKKGARIRLAISTSLWPLVWSPPTPVSLGLQLESCRLTVPDVPANHPAAEMTVPLTRPINPVDSGVKIEQIGPDETGRVELVKTWPSTPFVAKGGSGTDPLAQSGTERFEGWTNARLVTSSMDPNRGSWHIEFQERFRRGPDWDCRIEVGITLRSDESHFLVTEYTKAYEGIHLIHENAKETSILRDSV